MRKRLIPLLLALALIIALGTVSALADSSGKCGENLAWEYSNGSWRILHLVRKVRYEHS